MESVIGSLEWWTVYGFERLITAEEPFPRPSRHYHHYRQPNTCLDQIKREIQEDIDRDIFDVLDCILEGTPKLTARR